jgi:hypothetical protein
MNRISRFLRRCSFLVVVIAFASIALARACQAESSAKLEKHARKIEKRLGKYRTGTILQVDFRDSSEALGSLGNLSDATFQITNAESNKVQTFNYADVAHVKKGKEYIGAGSGPEHHIRLWVPLVVGTLAAGAVVTAVEVR